MLLLAAEPKGCNAIKCDFLCNIAKFQEQLGGFSDEAGEPSAGGPQLPHGLCFLRLRPPRPASRRTAGWREVGAPSRTAALPLVCAARRTEPGGGAVYGGRESRI